MKLKYLEAIHKSHILYIDTWKIAIYIILSPIYYQNLTLEMLH